MFKQSGLKIKTAYLIKNNTHSQSNILKSRIRHLLNKYKSFIFLLNLTSTKKLNSPINNSTLSMVYVETYNYKSK